MTPDLRQWRYFVAVADERHFGRAAERLSMTQPPLSQAIRALEDALGVALFARTKRSVELTAVGAALLPDVRRLIAAADALPPLAQSLARGEAGSLALAFVSTADYGLLPQLLREFGARYPHVRLQLAEATSDVQIEELVAGRIDAGLVIPPVPPRHAASLSYLPVLREPLIVAMPAEAAEVAEAAEAANAADAAADAPVRIADIASLPLVIFPRRLAPGFYDIITGCYGAAGVTPRIGQEAIQMQTIVSLVSAGMGVALVPQSLRNLRRTGVVYRALADPAPVVETGLVWRTDDVSPVLAGFIDVVRGAARRASPSRPGSTPDAAGEAGAAGAGRRASRP
ncbi:LysR substrate-binding domain-containing protein [Burkholderia pseudomallei]|uniref:LysR substrate-binding domain-containing protein n=1 Tax=Burkholderia pseudomallei TaxID=28450 RepID=UPI000977D1A4|nr:LysR substrate-binding domain-containing protein [Burkholderia pseudomallei]MBF3492042.1 LysR family transcriptional regulator [Burkholderia pseudomallei]MCW0089411.1 LysR substrate-binding domain-containing protein [Burkholderia pseudomallei]MCW0125766.1 LysR substrate-binding domain-containing protein [Burkholderia pseudomallei]MDK2569726.1 LysR substrate-binding domain-containing protein [Burkholderia pseudomallei]MDK2574414.1 LysR substrate-binding domain-containing protein [Burkholderi